MSIPTKNSEEVLTVQKSLKRKPLRELLTPSHLESNVLLSSCGGVTLPHSNRRVLSDPRSGSENLYSDEMVGFDSSRRVSAAILKSKFATNVTDLTGDVDYSPPSASGASALFGWKLCSTGTNPTSMEKKPHSTQTKVHQEKETYPISAQKNSTCGLRNDYRDMQLNPPVNQLREEISVYMQLPNDSADENSRSEVPQGEDYSSSAKAFPPSIFKTITAFGLKKASSSVKAIPDFLPEFTDSSSDEKGPPAQRVNFKDDLSDGVKTKGSAELVFNRDLDNDEDEIHASALSSQSDDAECAVCMDRLSTDEDPIIFCDGFCGTCVHLSCYGLEVKQYVIHYSTKKLLFL